jgi:hypothetical protein
MARDTRGKWNEEIMFDGKVGLSVKLLRYL